MWIPQVEQNVEKMSVVFYIIAFGLVPASSHYYKENTCHHQGFNKESRGLKYH